ncbi:semaphorin-6A-like [Sphaerodactylus townsendi]|uniref:semaphorin-6A-like n=1 Tax=Sphaerodactylus townsendi TaxID=933632 RepID=UPI002026C5B8|nr:semaphorin-6A-like [Sphaerodactylus townsendi]
MASFPEGQEPILLVSSEHTKGYLVFLGHKTRGVTNPYPLDIQQTMIMDRILYIAAKNNIYTVDMDISYKREIYFYTELTWEPTEAKKLKCIMFGNSEAVCHNFVKVLIRKSYNTLFICGTGAFDPSCWNVKVKTLKRMGDRISGKGRCPFNPKDSNVALYGGGYLYSGTASDLRSEDSLIYRSLGPPPSLRTPKQNSKWLKNPKFIHVVDYGSYMYFFFQEVAVEVYVPGELVVSRVARVCKNDMGGTMAFLDQQWTSFVKAQLKCLIPSALNFNFDILQGVTDVVQIQGHDVVFATFTTSEFSIPGSAVCAYDMLEIDKVFSGKFKRQLYQLSMWTPVPENQVPTPRPGSCAGTEPLEQYESSNDFPDNILEFMAKHHLMDEGVSSTGSYPWFLRTMVKNRITKIAVDVSAGPKKNHVVAFLGSQMGMLWKVMDTSGDGAFLSNSVFLEEIDVYNPDKCQYKGTHAKRIVSLQLDKPSGVLYVAFRHCLIKVPLGRCELHGTCKKACITSRDPYCGWVKKSEECTYLRPGDGQKFEQDIEHGNGNGLDDC